MPVEGLRVLYDGWSLAFAPNSPQALHLLALLAHLPPEVQPRVTVPVVDLVYEDGTRERLMENGRYQALA